MNSWYGPGVQPFHQQKPRPKPTITNNLSWVLSRYLKSRLRTPHSHATRETIFGLYIHARSYCHLCARQNLRKLRCWTHLLKWEPLPKPLVPKNPLKFIDVGIFFALRKKIMMITPLTKAINSRNEWIERGCKFGERKEREREKERIWEEENTEKERKVISLGTLV